MIKKIGLLPFLIFTVTACSTIQIGSEDNYRNELQAYVGGDISNIVEKRGHADYLSQAPNGNRLFVYSTFRTSTSPISCKTDSQGKERCTGGDTSEHSCKTYFEVNSRNIVTDYSFKGNDCSSCKSKNTLLCI